LIGGNDAYLFDAALYHIQKPVVTRLQNGAFKHRCVQHLQAVKKTKKKKNKEERTNRSAGGLMSKLSGHVNFSPGTVKHLLTSTMERRHSMQLLMEG
jgi:hypothetical protein